MDESLEPLVLRSQRPFSKGDERPLSQESRRSQLSVAYNEVPLSKVASSPYVSVFLTHKRMIEDTERHC